MQRPLVVPRSPPPAVTSRRMLMGLIGSGMCLSDVTCPQPPAEHPLSRITRTTVLLSLVRAPALPPRHAYFGSQSHTPYDRCLRFGPRVAATPARLAPVPSAQLWTDQTCTGKLIPASPIAPRIRLSDKTHAFTTGSAQVGPDVRARNARSGARVDKSRLGVAGPCVWTAATGASASLCSCRARGRPGMRSRH